MLSFLLKKMLKNKWMTFSLLIGNVLLIGIVSAIPLYADATMQRLLLRQNDNFIAERGMYPGMLEFTASINVKASDRQLERLDAMGNFALEGTKEAFGLPSHVQREKLSVVNYTVLPEVQLQEKPRNMAIDLCALSDFEDHASITLGRMARDGVENGVIEAVVSRKAYDNLNILLDTVYASTRATVGGQPVRYLVTGVFDSKLESDYYWTPAPSTLGDIFVVGEQVFRDYLLPGLDQDYQLKGVWTQNLDIAAMKVRDVDAYLTAAGEYVHSAKTHTVKYTLREYFTTVLSGYNEESAKLNVTLWVLQTPMFVMLAFFIFMVTKQILVIDRNDISVLKSRGASRGYIMGMYALQGFLIAAVSAAAGYGLGILICRVTGASNGFLNLVERTSLPVSASPKVFAYIGVAAALSMLTMILPVIQYSKVTIVDLKREKATRRRSLWQILFLDFIALGLALYGLYSFYSRREAMALNGEALRSVDPLLFIASSLFIIGLGLLCLRVFPWIVRLIFRVFKNVFSPALYVSFLRVIRSIGDEQFIMIFLIFTLATGIFNAKVARTLNLNAENTIRHQAGADIRVMEVWKDNSQKNSSFGPDAEAEPQSFSTESTVYYEPDFNRYADMPQVDEATKVLNHAVTVSLPEGKADGALMGIITDQFGRVANMGDGMLPTHFYNYLNTLSRDPKAVLLSSNFKRHFRIGDVISYRREKDNAMGIVYGFVDYWPGFVGYERTQNKDGSWVEKENWLVVANLNYLQSTWGMRPYEVWMRTNTDSNNFLVRYANDHELRYTVYEDAKAGIIESRNTPVLQGTSGVLTVDFIITLLICAAGFLIYWILSIKGRVLQFGIFRAMGMSVRNILGILVNEQFLISGIAIVLGVLVGEVASRLYVPLIQLAYSASEQIIPIQIVSERGDYLRIFGVVGIMIAACLVILGVIASQIKIVQALKLGED